LRRLAPIGLEIGVYSDTEESTITQRLKEENLLRSFVESTSISPEEAEAHLIASASSQLSHPVKLVELTRRPGVSLAKLLDAVGAAHLTSREAVLSTEMEIKYAGYFERERSQAQRLRQMGDFRLASDLPYTNMKSLSFEARQKLSSIKPRTLAQASNIPGVSPSDLQNLVIEVERNRRLEVPRVSRRGF
jgi:tRNA uridine 5-carboxymethylaminomethyl modification enzyme